MVKFRISTMLTSLLLLEISFGFPTNENDGMRNAKVIENTKRKSEILDITKDLPIVTDNLFSWTDHAGNHRFGYEAGDHWRSEERSADGEVKGSYGYKTPEGDLVVTKFTAGVNGYQHTTNITSSDPSRISMSRTNYLKKSQNTEDKENMPIQVLLKNQKIDLFNVQESRSQGIFQDGNTFIVESNEPTSNDNSIPYGALQFINNPLALSEGTIDDSLDAIIIDTDIPTSNQLSFLPNQYFGINNNVFQAIWEPAGSINNIPSVKEPNFHIAPASLMVKGPSFLSIPVRHIPVYAARPIKQTLNIR